jgi:hypothetical protein
VTAGSCGTEPMTFAAVGSLIQATSSTFTLVPGGVGDLILIEVVNRVSTAVTATALSSSNVTWSAFGASFAGTANTMTAQVFAGKVTSASSATVTVTWSGIAPTTFYIAGQEFSSTAGSWALDAQGDIDSAGTNTWASLTPAGPGELYFGYAFDSGSATAGSTSGYTYDVDSASNGCGFNPACTSSAQAPVWGDSGHEFGIMVLVRETGATPAGRPSSGWFAARTVPNAAVWGGVAASSNAPAPGSAAAPRAGGWLIARTVPNAAVWGGAAAAAPAAVFVAVPAPRQQPGPARRRIPARAYVRFTPVAGLNAAPVPPVTGRGRLGVADYDGKSWWKKRRILGL